MAIDPKAIEPNSTAYGDRQTLEQGLAQVGGEGGTSAPTTSVPPMAPPSDPLTAMLSGGLKAPDAPLTQGLSVGPGDGPAGEPGPFDTDLGQKLKMLANQTTSPMLRRLAVAKLRQLYRGVDLG